MAELTPWQAHFTQLARYNVWATERLLQAIEPVSELDYRRDLRLFFKSIHGTLNHLLVGEHLLWQRRFAQALKGGAKVWERLIAEWPVERFDGKLNYTNMRGQAMSLPFAATLAHVFNHGTHHRGQITAALTFLGQPGPELDLVYFLQQNP